MRKFEFTVTKEEEGHAVRRLLKQRFGLSSRLLAKLKAQRRIFLNGRVYEGWMRLAENDVVTAVLPEETSGFEPESIPFQVLYEDQDLLVIDKPAGYTVHPTKGHPNHTMANAVMKYMQDRGDSYKIRFANRLDMDTSGLLIVAKNAYAQDEIIRQMDEDHLEKTYTALVNGILEEDDLTIDTPIGHSDPDSPKRNVTAPGEGRPSVTIVHVVRRLPGHTLCEIRLMTGRTHQIRVHLSSIGHPLTGDPLYGGDAPDLIDRQALHASHLAFYKPGTRERVELYAPLPPDMLAALRILEPEDPDAGPLP